MDCWSGVGFAGAMHWVLSVRGNAVPTETIRSVDLIVPVKRDGQPVDMRLRTVAKSDEDVALLLSHLGLRLPKGSKIVENVVEKIALN